MSESSVESDYKATWKVFDKDWDKMCAYHRDQAISINKATFGTLFSPEEGLAELRRLREERERCKECGR